MARAFSIKMAPSFTEMLLSPQFTFLLGEDRVPVTVHASVMSNLSEPLDRLINGPMKEAQEKCAVLPHAEKDVFLALVEFAYRGDYNGGPWPDSPVEVEVSEKPAAEEEQNEDEDGHHVEGADHPDWYDPEHYPSRRERSVNKSYPPLTDSRSQFHLALDLRLYSFGYSSLSLEHIFLLNAKMYCLAEYYIIPALKNLALPKLHEMLGQCLHYCFLTKQERVEDIAALVAYAYNSDNIADHGTCWERDPLREEVLEYVVAHIKYFENHPAFQKLLTGGGQLATDVVSCLSAGRHVEQSRIEAAMEDRHQFPDYQPDRW